MTSASKPFLRAAVVTSVVFLVAFTWLLQRNGELYTVTSGARHHLRTQGIYLRSIWHDYYPYKLAMYQLRPTGAMSVGSSRAMSVRSFLFKNSDHYSAGGVIQGLDDAKAFVAELKSWRQRPHALLLFVDFAWFANTGLNSYNIVDRRLFDQFTYLYQSGFVHVGDLLRSAYTKHEAGAGIVPTIGARARRLGDGFRVDGSMRFHGFETGTRYDEPELYTVLGDVEGALGINDARDYSKKRRWWGSSLKSEALAAFDAVLGELQAMNIQVVMIMPPVAPHLAISLHRASELSFFTQATSQLSAMAERRHVPLFDFTEIPMREADCWVDRYHASEGAYAWVLKQVQRGLARREHPIAELFDPDMLERASGGGCLRSLSLLAPAGHMTDR